MPEIAEMLCLILKSVSLYSQKGRKNTLTTKKYLSI